MPTPDKVREHELLQLNRIERFALTLQKILEVELAKKVSKINFKNSDKKKLVDLVLQLESVIRDANLDSELEKIKEIYAKEISFIRESFNYYQIPLEFNEQDKELIRGIIQLDTESVKNNMSGWMIDVRTSLISNAILQKIPDLDELSNIYGDRMAARVKTELNTAASMFNGELSFQKATEVLGKDPLMLYVGVLDKLTRPFCRERVGKTYRLSEVKKMDNGQKLDVVTSKGGYNCRHIWAYVTDDYKAS